MEPTQEEIAEAAAVFKRYASMSKADRAAVIDTGMFNSIIEAYLTVTLYSMNAPKAKIELARGVLKAVLDDTPAAVAVDLAAEVMN